MANIAIQHTFQGMTLLPEDRFVNTFYATDAAAFPVQDLPAIATAIRQFYRPTVGEGFAPYMASGANAVGETVKIYDLADAKPRAPIYTFVNDAVPGLVNTGDDLPEEVAICMSFEGPHLSGVPQARRRGRVYLGPLNTLALDTVAPEWPVRVSGVVISAILIQAANLRLALFQAGADWAVYSPTTNVANDGTSGMTSITSVWVDNAFDTQRRRGTKPTQKFFANMAG